MVYIVWHAKYCYPDPECFDRGLSDDDQQKRLILEGKRVAKKKVIICDDYPTLAGNIADWVMNVTNYHGKTGVPLSFRHPDEWADMISCKSICKKVSLPWWYPFKHFVLTASKKTI